MVIEKESEMSDIVREAEGLLNKYKVPFVRVYEYGQCSEEYCGRMPRVIVEEEGEVPVCYHLDELRKRFEGGA